MTIEIAQQVSNLLKEKIRLEEDLSNIYDTKHGKFIIGFKTGGFMHNYTREFNLEEIFIETIKEKTILYLKGEILNIENKIKSLNC